MLRMMAMWCMFLAIIGMCSQIATPGALVWICLKGPPVGAPGFKSQISIVDGPPPIQSMIALLPLRLSSWVWAWIDWANARAGPAMAAPAAMCFMKCRRDIPRGEMNAIAQLLNAWLKD